MYNCIVKYFVGFLVLCILHYGSCLKCYSCDSISNGDCSSLSVDSDKYLIDCELDKLGFKMNNPVCYQAHGKVNLMIADGEAVVRGCADKKPVVEDACGSFQFPFHLVGMNCTTCTKDKCNGDYIETAHPAIRIVTPIPPGPRSKNGTSGAFSLSPMAGMLVVSIGCMLIPNI